MCDLCQLDIQITKLQPKRGDVLVIRTADDLDSDQRQYLANHLRAKLPEGIAVLIADGRPFDVQISNKTE